MKWLHIHQKLGVLRNNPSAKESSEFRSREMKEKEGEIRSALLQQGNGVPSQHRAGADLVADRKGFISEYLEAHDGAKGLYRSTNSCISAINSGLCHPPSEVLQNPLIPSSLPKKPRHLHHFSDHSIFGPFIAFVYVSTATQTFPPALRPFREGATLAMGEQLLHESRHQASY